MFHAVVDLKKRLMTANNHTATHLLHHALRKVLGNHVEQKGSLVTPERLRFDFSHFARLTREELRKVEEEANRMVRVSARQEAAEGVPMEEARRMGAIALFGEKYGDTVRVVRFGESVELCGGTHAENTGRIGIIKITSEGGIAAGIRRIEAVTAEKAEEYINDRIEAADDVAALLKSSGNIRESVERLLTENSQLKKTIEKLQASSAMSMIRELEEKAVTINGIRYISGIVETESADMLKNIAYQIRSTSDITVVVIGASIGDKANIFAMVSDNLVNSRNINAVEIIREIAGEIKGGGGGQPFLASAGGKNPSGLPAALSRAEAFLRKKTASL